MASTDADRRGDPAFAGDDRITHEPVIEQDRESPVPDSDTLRRPFPWAVIATVLVVLGVAIVAGASVGWQYAIPFAVLGALIGVFLGVHRAQGRMATVDYPEGRAEDAAAADAENPVPHLGFDEETQLGASSEQSDAERAAHADVERSPGRR
jgi:hypothetical protein